MNNIYSELPLNKKLYFASDFHLRHTHLLRMRDREMKIIAWLDTIAQDACTIFLVGDIFDFWFEYKQTIPKGYVRFLGKLAELSDRGISIVAFTGNHDIWLGEYLTQEIGVEVITKPTTFNFGEKSFYIAHGDDLGPRNKKFKLLKRIFTNSLCIWLFRWLHPDIGVALGQYWTNRSRVNQSCDNIFQYEKERQVIHSRQMQTNYPHDYYIYGHRHVVIQYSLNDKSTYINLGDWSHYGVWDGVIFSLSKLDAP